MMNAGISQTTWKWTPLSWISDHWSMTVRTRKPKIEHGDADLQRERGPACCAAARVPNRAPASPIRCRSGCLRSTRHVTLVGG